MKLVLLPGLDGTGVLFRPFVAALPPDIEPIVVSYPGREPLGYEQLLPRVLSALPSEPFALLGESFGGPLALQVAAVRPAKLRAVILAGSFVSCPVGPAPKWSAHAVMSWPFYAFPLFAKIKSQLGLFEAAAQSALSVEALSQVAPSVLAARVREIIRVDVAAELAACTVPVLYLQGKRDRVVWAGNLRRILKINAAVQVAAIDASHMILKTQPVAATEAIAAFLRRV